MCDFEDGFVNEEHNVIKAISNYTDRLAHHGE